MSESHTSRQVCVFVCLNYLGYHRSLCLFLSLYLCFFVIFCYVFQATTGLERVVGPIEICLVFVPINSARERKSDSNDVSNLWRDWRLKVYKGGKKKAKVTD